MTDDRDLAGTPVDVLIVGAGPTGLALAVELVAHGARVRIVDRQTDRAHESRALAIQPRTLEVLARHGLARPLVEAGNRAVQLRMHVRRRTLAIRLFDLGLDDTAYPYLLFLSQAETERILGDYLGSLDVTVERGVELVDLRPIADFVVATLRHPDGQDEIVHARYIAGCDGAHSTVRRAAGIAFEGGAYPQVFVLADLEADGIEPGAAHAFLSERGLLFFFPLGSPATWRVLAMRPLADPTPSEVPVTLEDVQALVDAYTDTPVRLHDPVWMTNFRLHHRAATHYRSGRVFLAGDAAHIHSPAGGQGMNTGIQDAANLGWKLAYVVRGSASPAVLDTYDPERAPVGRTVLRFTDRAFMVATSTNPIVRFARTRLPPVLIPVAMRAKRGRAYAFRTVSQLGIRYRRSQLSLDGPHPIRRGPRAGDRLPDASIVHDGQSGTLHAAVASPGWHLLLCGPAAAWPVGQMTEILGPNASLITVHRVTAGEEPDVLHDPGGEALYRLGLSARDTAQYLVRPDGYIGYRTGGTNFTGLTRYLHSWLTAPHARADQAG